MYVVGRNEGLRDFFNQLMKAVIRCAKKTSSVNFVVPSGLLPSKAVKSGRGRNLALKPCPSVSPRPSLFPPLRLFRWGGSRRKSRPRGREKRPNKTSPPLPVCRSIKKNPSLPSLSLVFLSLSLRQSLELLYFGSTWCQSKPKTKEGRGRIVKATAGPSISLQLFWAAFFHLSVVGASGFFCSIARAVQQRTHRVCTQNPSPFPPSSASLSRCADKHA